MKPNFWEKYYEKPPEEIPWQNVQAEVKHLDVNEDGEVMRLYMFTKESLMALLFCAMGHPSQSLF